MELPEKLLNQFPELQPKPKRKRNRSAKKKERPQVSTEKSRRLRAMSGVCKKKRYATENEAKRSANAYNSLNHNLQHDYQCPICRFYHLTKSK
jgi:hypothetical protein